jgi:hypothetical protein
LEPERGTGNLFKTYCSTLPNLGATNRIGFWLNIIVIGAVDIGYVNAADRTGLLPRVVRRARRPDRLCDWCNVFDRWFVAPRFGSVEQLWQLAIREGS